MIAFIGMDDLPCDLSIFDRVFLEKKVRINLSHLQMLEKRKRKSFNRKNLLWGQKFNHAGALQKKPLQIIDVFLRLIKLLETTILCCELILKMWENNELLAIFYWSRGISFSLNTLYENLGLRKRHGLRYLHISYF